MSIAYQDFAYVYDKFMDNIPYEEWSRYLKSLFHQYSITDGTLIELGCGTGILSLLMHKAGYSVIGVDNSTDMLSLAAEKVKDTSDITLLCQDMRELELGNAYDGFYCICDGLNYLLSSKDILSTFRGVKKHLRENGIFIFDLKTPYFYEYVLGDQAFCDHQEDCSYIWENSYFEEDCINQYDLTIFVKHPDSGLFERCFETHHQKAYHLTEIIDLLSESGLEYITAYDAFSSNPPNSTSERIYIIARNKKGES